MQSLLHDRASCSRINRTGKLTTLTRHSSTPWTATASAQQLLLLLQQQQQQRQQDRHGPALLATFHLGPLEYPSKNAATRAGKDLLSGSGSAPGKEFHPGDTGFDFLWHAWQHDQDAHAYAHKGVSHFSIRSLDKSVCRASRCFWVHFLDGDNRDFSYRQVLDSKVHAAVMQRGGWTGPPAPRTAPELAAANKAAQAFAHEMQHAQTKQYQQPVPDGYYYQSLRAAVWGQIEAFRASARQRMGNRFTCPVTNEWVPFDKAHVDHSTAFVVLVHKWLQQEGLQLTDVPHGAWLEQHQRMLMSWQQYHRQHAEPRMVSSRGNQQRTHVAKLALAAAKASTSSSGDAILSESGIGSSRRSNSSSSCSTSSSSAVSAYLGNNSGTSTADSSSNISSRDTAVETSNRRRRRQLRPL